jgi:hypothetical protein
MLACQLRMLVKHEIFAFAQEIRSIESPDIVVVPTLRGAIISREVERYRSDNTPVATACHDVLKQNVKYSKYRVFGLACKSRHVDSSTIVQPQTDEKHRLHDEQWLYWHTIFESEKE